jgi:hypothetical protein
VCTTGDTAHIDTIFKFLQHTRQHECIDILHCCKARVIAAMNIIDVPMRNLDSCRCWRCTFYPGKVINSFIVNFWNRTILLWIPCLYGAHCKARNFKAVYIWTYVWQRWKPSLSICCTMFLHWINSESFPVSQLCVTILPATKITLITNGI